MPWKECHVMDERLRFVARLLEGEKMEPLCAEFGISRKTGYKIFDRYKDCGVAAFTDRSRRPYRQANRLPPQLEAVIVRLKREYPDWGAPKIREKLLRQSSAPHLPAISTVHAVLDRHGLVKRRRRRRFTSPCRSRTAWTVLMAGSCGAVDCRRSFSRIFGAPSRGIPASTAQSPLQAAAAVDSPGGTAGGCDP